LSQVIKGLGIHSGDRASVEFHPAEGPVRFRIGKTEILPRAASVVDTARATVLGAGGVRIATVEHLMAAFALRGIYQGVLIEVQGQELPGLGGGAKEWYQALAEFPAAAPAACLVKEEVSVSRGQSQASAGPGDEFSFTVSVEFAHPLIGKQCFASPPRASLDVLDARTFGFARESAALWELGLAQGSMPSNTLIFSDSRSIGPLRGADEPVRHKALDFLGDLYLLGRPARGDFRVHRGSHQLHLELVRRLEVLCQS
jgi:UDP-3-O-[3-hydroxymyristoyl] N-acetylglucosamine deacetylase